MPDSFEDHCIGTHLVYQYNTLNILDCPDEELETSKNPFAYIVLAAKKALLKGKDLDALLLEQKLLIVRRLYESGMFRKKKIRAILSFLSNYVLFKNSETNRNFMRQVDLITGKKNTMGIIEQVQEIRAEEAREKSVKAFLTNTDFSVEKIADMLELPVAFVKKVKASIRPKLRTK